MIATVDHIAPVVELHRPPRPNPASDLHARLVAELNRLLNAAAADRSGAMAQGALDHFSGMLLNALPPGGRPLPKRDIVELVERTGDWLGCPPANAAAPRRRRAPTGHRGLGGQP